MKTIRLILVLIFAIPHQDVQANKDLEKEKYLESLIIPKLKNWDSTGFVKTNFNGSASGFIDSKGTSLSKGYCATFWTTDTTGGNYSKIWYLTSNSDQLLFHDFNKRMGNAIRCVKAKK